MAEQPDAPYDPEFYDMINAGSLISAQVIVPLVIDHLGHPDVVIDVGCGEGAWLSVWKERGAIVKGLDGAHVNRDRLLIDDHEFVEWDLENTEIPFEMGTVDLVTCLEVAEHLSPERALSFVRDLCRLAPVILWSAAIPHQGGVGHVNEQWPNYWQGLFAAHGFLMSGALRWEIWDDLTVEPWYRQNLMVCARTDHPISYTPLFEATSAKPFGMVHPVVWDHHKAMLEDAE